MKEASRHPTIVTAWFAVVVVAVARLHTWAHLFYPASQTLYRAIATVQVIFQEVAFKCRLPAPRGPFAATTNRQAILSVLLAA